MEKKMKNFKKFLLFVFSFFLTVFFSVYQRVTGPTHPFFAKLKVLEKEYKLKFPRSQNTGEDAKIVLPIDEKLIRAELYFKNISEDGDWERVEFKREGKELYATLKTLPPAGKYHYYVKIYYFERQVQIPDKPISIRFKGKVPDLILIIHILIIFTGFLLSIYTGLYTYFYEIKIKLILFTFILFFIGAGVLGPIVQYYAFGQFWTGFPWGKDLTDNKGLILIIFWGVAYFKARKGKGKLWVYIAFLFSILTFFIPHSMWGSELKGGKIKTGP